MSLIKSDRNKVYQSRIIGVCGIDRGVGTTSLAIALANMASCLGWHTVILIEVGSQHTFSKIRKYYESEILTKDASFRYDRVEYMSNVSVMEVLKITKRKHTFVVLDCGSEPETYSPYLSLCTKKFLLCSLLPWKIKIVEWMLANVVGNQDWDSILVTTGKRELTRIRKKTGHKLESLDLVDDPYALSRKAVDTLYQLACEEKYITRNSKRTWGMREEE